MRRLRNMCEHLYWLWYFFSTFDNHFCKWQFLTLSGLTMVQDFLYFSTISVAAVLMAYNGIFLFLKGADNRGRRVLGFTNAAWSAMFIVFVVCDLLGITITNYPLLSHKTLVLGNFMICIMFFFPLEVVVPGWLTNKRLLLLFTPAILVTSVYYFFLWLLEEQIEELFVFSEVWASLSHFNVWYRVVMLLCNIAYCFVLLRFIYRHEQKYLRWQEDYYSDRDEMDISWMHFYFKMIVLFLLLYLVIAIWGSKWSIILDVWLSVLAFSVVFYKGLFHENPYPEDFYCNSVPQKETSLPGDDALRAKGEGTAEGASADYSFEMKIPQYLATLKGWMEVEKPYLYKDFKLTDAARVLPLNRTYLSRLFNEGLRQTFSEVVREYRVTYAKQLLVDHPEMAIYEVAKASGFSSDSSFIKAFQKVTGTTPRQYRVTTEA